MAHTHPIAITRRSTPEQIANGLRDLVLSGDLPPGRPIRESVLATDLGVSRNTVREAVRILERSGLVQYEMHRGAVVRQPSVLELRDLYEARLAIEVGAAMAANPDDTIVTVRPAFERLCAALAKKDVKAGISADLAFHEAIVASANSRRLASAFAPLLNELRLYLAILSTTLGEYEDAERIAAEHERIVSAFEARDRAAAVHELQGHIRGDADRLASILGADPMDE